MPPNNPTPSTLPALFKGGPSTRVADGDQRIIVHARALTPLRARLAAYATPLTGAALFLYGGFDLIDRNAIDLSNMIEVGVIAGIAIPVTWFGLRRLLQTGRVIVFTPEQIAIRGFLGWRHFDRARPHGFVLLPHDKSEKERERHEFLDRKRPPKWWSLKRRKYCGESRHVALEFLGERHDILTVHGRKKAAAIQARLQACDAVMDGMGTGDSGVSLSPDGDWGAEAGAL